MPVWPQRGVHHKLLLQCSLGRGSAFRPSTISVEVKQWVGGQPLASVIASGSGSDTQTQNHARYCDYIDNMEGSQDQFNI